MESFYITLPSTASAHLYNNSQSQFRVQLPQPIELSGNWSVGLCEIHVPCTWDNINDKTDTFIIRPKHAFKQELHHRLHVPGAEWTDFSNMDEERDFFGKWFSNALNQLPDDLNPLITLSSSVDVNEVCLTLHNHSEYNLQFPPFLKVECDVISPIDKIYKFHFTRNGEKKFPPWVVNMFYPKFDDACELKIPHGFYPRVEDVLDAMREVIPEKYRNLYHIKSNKNGTVSILCKESADLLFPETNPGLGEMLGFDTGSTAKNAHGKYVADLKGGVYGLYVYSDIAQPHVVGDTFASLLRVIPVDNSRLAHSSYVKIYANPDFYSVMQNRFESIEIDIRTDSAQKLKFTHGKTLVKLLFKKV